MAVAGHSGPTTWCLFHPPGNRKADIRRWNGQVDRFRGNYSGLIPLATIEVCGTPAMLLVNGKPEEESSIVSFGWERVAL